MGIFEAIIGAVAGAIIGDHFGIAGGIGPFRPENGAMNASIPFALTGLVIGGLLGNGSNNPQFPPPNVEPPEYNQQIKEVEQTISNTFNHLRMIRGFQQCQNNLSISMVARYKSQDVYQTNSLESETYGSLDNMLRGFGIKYGVGYVSIAGDYKNPNFSIYQWLSHPNNSELINNPKFNQIGVGYCARGDIFTIIALEQ